MSESRHGSHRIGDIGNPRIGTLTKSHELTDVEEERRRIIGGRDGTVEREFGASTSDVGKD